MRATPVTTEGERTVQPGPYGKADPTMMRRQRPKLRHLTIALLVIVLLLLVPVVLYPDSSVRQGLLVVELITGGLLLITSIMLVWAKLESLTFQLQVLQYQFRRHVGEFQLRQTDSEVDKRILNLADLLEQRNAS